MPVFAEAAERYTHNVFFPDFRDVFAIAESKAGLESLVERAIAGERLLQPAPERRAALLDSYLGYGDGRTAERAVQVLRAVAAGAPPPLRFAPASPGSPEPLAASAVPPAAPMGVCLPA